MTTHAHTPRIVAEQGQSLTMIREGIHALTNAHKGGYHTNNNYASRGLLGNIATLAPRSAFAGKQEKETDAMRFGVLYHTVCLEPHLVDEQYVVFDKEQRPELDKTFASKANKEWKASFIADAEREGRIVVDSFEMAQAQAMKRALSATLDIDAYMTPHGTREVAYFVDAFPFFNPIAGTPDTAPVRVLIDYHDDALLLDLKSYGGTIDKRGFLNKSYAHAYHIQAALYRDVLEHVLEFNDDAHMPFYFAVQEKDAPYSACMFLASDDFIANGKREYEMALALWKQFHDVDANTLPTYYNGAREPLDVQPWCEFATDERIDNMTRYARMIGGK